MVVAAEPGELRGILRRCAARERLRWPVWYARSGKLNGNRLVLVADGAGADRARRAVRTALDRGKPDAVVSTGFCGALDPSFRPGEVFVAVRVEAGGSTYAGAIPPSDGRFFRSGTLASVEKVVGSTAEKARLHARGAAAVDMEAGAVALEACRNRLPFYCIRAVLDPSNESFHLDFNALRSADGRFSRAKILKAALKRPLACLPELVKIGRRARLAGNALGEFIGTCRF